MEGNGTTERACGIELCAVRTAPFGNCDWRNISAWPSAAARCLSSLQARNAATPFGHLSNHKSFGKTALFQGSLVV